MERDKQVIRRILATLPTYDIYRGLRHELETSKHALKNLINNVWGNDWPNKNPNRPNQETENAALKYLDDVIKECERRLEEAKDKKKEFVRKASGYHKQIDRLDKAVKYLEFTEGELEISQIERTQEEEDDNAD